MMNHNLFYSFLLFVLLYSRPAFSQDNLANCDDCNLSFSEMGLKSIGIGSDWANYNNDGFKVFNNQTKNFVTYSLSENISVLGELKKITYYVSVKDNSVVFFSFKIEIDDISFFKAFAKKAQQIKCNKELIEIDKLTNIQSTEKCSRFLRSHHERNKEYIFAGYGYNIH